MTHDNLTDQRFYKEDDSSENYSQNEFGCLIVDDATQAHGEDNSLQHGRQLETDSFSRIPATCEPWHSGEVTTSSLPFANAYGINSFEDSEEVMIACWPYGNAGGIGSIEARDNVKKVVYVFAIVWLAVFIFEHFNAINFGTLQIYKLLILAVVPLMCMTRGLTHINLNPYGIKFLSSSVNERCLRQFSWASVTRVYLRRPLNKGILDCEACFQLKGGKVHKIKLSKIANRQQWLSLVDAINRWSPVAPEGFDRTLMDTLSADRDNPTYTMLWLEALSAPPRREKFQPLSNGSNLRQGRFKIVRTIGGGGQGKAYLADDSNSGGQVVLKEYILPVYVDSKARRQAIQNFENEARILNRLDNPGIVKLLDFFIDDHRAYHVLEYIDGVTLKSIVETQGPVSGEEAIAFTDSLCDILSHLHNQSPPIVHGDFTPDNLILTSGGKLKLIDFMVARQQSEISNTSMSIVGKHSYMAPEQFRGQLSTLCDIYALGCTMYFMMVGQDPTPLSQLFPIIERDGVLPELDEIVSKCTAQSPGERFCSAEEVRHALQRIEPPSLGDCSDVSTSSAE